MARLTTGLGILLIVMAIVCFVATGAEHPTALIPIGIGLPLLICGLLAANEARRKHAMHGAAVFALLGLCGTAPGVIKLFKYLGGSPVKSSPVALGEQTATAILCLAFLIAAINSFRAARRSAK